MMTARLNPYLTFGDNAREAMSFYQDALGGDLAISTFGEYGGEPADGVMHAMLQTPAGFVLMASDNPPGRPYNPGDSISLSLSGGPEDDQALRGYFAALAEGGQVTMPLEKQMWGDVYGSCVDRFGVSWLVNIGQATE